jgi:peptidyl-prolyl cis-trans isomerase C
MAEPERIVARVNGEPIYEEQLNAGVERGFRVFRKYSLRGQAPDPVLIKRLRTRALDEAIEEELLFQESQKLEIEDIDERVDEKLKAMEAKYGGREQFANSLKRKHLTLRDARASLRAGIYRDEYLKKTGISEPQISEQRIREAYERNPGAYSRQESVKVSHILIAVEGNAESEQKKQALKRAERIREAVLDGQDFAETAKKHSDCKSASDGGSLGYIKRGYMPTAFDAVAFEMSEESVSGVVTTEFGYHIIKVFDKRAAGVTPYEEAREFVEKYLQEEESKRRRAAHLVELRKRANIEIFLDESEPLSSSGYRTRAGASDAARESEPPPPARR